MDFNHASGDFLEESEEDSRESFYLDSKTRFLCTSSQSPPAAVTECGWTCRLEELLSCNTLL